MKIRGLLTFITFLLIAAHFFRHGYFLLVAAALTSPFLLLIKRRWANILLQIVTWIVAFVWIVVAAQLVKQRVAFGQPFRGVIVILGLVTLFTVITASLISRFPSD